jgi:4-amino-4-deoxy-L-arabinose transferase-like glycosyltransferase
VNDDSTSTPEGLQAEQRVPWQQRLRLVTEETWFWAFVSSIAVCYGLRAAWYFFDMNASLHFDDGYVTAVGERLLDGQLLPYVDAASHRGPVMYWLAALAQALGGRMEWYGIRALTSMAFLTSLFGVWGAALLVRRRLVSALGGLSFVFISLSLLELQTVFGLVGEAMATPWIVAAFFVTTLALGRPQSFRARCWLLAAAGVLSALSGLTKQTYLIVVAPLALWAVAVALSDSPERDSPEGAAPATSSSRFRRWAPVGALVLGWLLPSLLVVLLYAAKGELRAFYYWFYRYNVDVYMAPYADARVPKALYRWARDNGFLSFALVLLLTSVAGQHLAPVLAAGRNLARAYARRGFEITIWLQAVLALAIGFSTLRFWQQYFLPPVPWLALLIGLSLEHGLGQNPHQPRAGKPAEGLSWAALLAIALGLGGFAVCMMEQLLYGLAREREQGSFVDARPERLCREIDRFAPAGEPLYIWGFDAEYYITCRRRPASRYVYSTLVSGSVPPDWGIHLEWSARGSIYTLLADLEEAQPPLILDSPQRVHGVSMTQIEQLDHFLHDNYCNVGLFRSNDGRRMTGWQRRDLCPAPAAALAPSPR